MKNLINQEIDIEANYLYIWMYITKETGKRAKVVHLRDRTRVEWGR